MTVTVWTQPGCGPCYAVKRALDAGGVRYVERNAAEADAATLARWRAAGMRTPVVQYPGGEFSGFLPARVQFVIDSRRSLV